MTLTVKRELTLPLLSIQHSPSIVLVADGEITETTMPGPGGSEPTPAWVIEGHLHGETGHVLLLLTTVMRTSLARAGTPLTGRVFKFELVGKRPGKRYSDVVVSELEETE